MSTSLHLNLDVSLCLGMPTTSPLASSSFLPPTKLGGTKRDNKDDLDQVREICDYLKKSVTELVLILFLVDFSGFYVVNLILVRCATC